MFTLLIVIPMVTFSAADLIDLLNAQLEQSTDNTDQIKSIQHLIKFASENAQDGIVDIPSSMLQAIGMY